MLSFLFQAPQGVGQTAAEATVVFTIYDFVVNIGVATLLGVVLALVYRHTHKGLS